MPTKTTGKDYNELLPGFDTSRTQINPAPGNTQQRGRGAALEKRKRKLGMHVKIYSYESRFCLLTILMDSQVSKSLKQRFLILLLCRPALHLSLSLSLSLALSLSLIQIVRSAPTNCSNYRLIFHTAMRSIINGHACGCCAVLKL